MQLGEQATRLFLASTPEQGGVVRERAMADLVMRVLERYPADRAIVWAHNLHVARAPFVMPELAEAPLDPMGIHLSAALGEDYLAIGAAFGRGRYPAELPPGARTFEVPALDSLDGALAAVGRRHFLVDLRDPEPGSEAGRWLSASRVWRAQDADATVVPADALDLVFYVDTISRARPSARALERFR